MKIYQKINILHSNTPNLINRHTYRVFPNGLLQLSSKHFTDPEDLKSINIKEFIS